MKDLMQTMLRDRYATTEEFEELADSSVRDDIQRAVSVFDGNLSYDPVTGTATILLPPREETYSTLERATMLICWAHFIYRRGAYRSQPQTDNMGVLTHERAAELRAKKRYTLKPQQLAADFPNLYPEARQATTALNALAELKILARDGDAYAAGPLLPHVVNEQDARALLEGELRGDFESFKPTETTAGALRPRLLDLLRILPRGDAKRKVLTERLGTDWKTLRTEIDRLKDEGIVEQERAGPATFYTLAIDLDNQEAAE